jgi:hypothetical protein
MEDEMTDEQIDPDARLLGVCAGTISAMVMLKLEIGRMRYHQINPRHTRRIAAREGHIAPLKAIYDRLERELRKCQAAMREMAP